jgi:hypothetical protein
VVGVAGGGSFILLVDLHSTESQRSLHCFPRRGSQKVIVGRIGSNRFAVVRNIGMMSSKLIGMMSSKLVVTNAQSLL